MDRRKLLRFLGLGSLFGVPAAASAAPVVQQKMTDGVLSFYIDVGTMSPAKVEAFMGRVKAAFAAKATPGWARVFTPTREGPTRVEAQFPGQNKGEAEKIITDLKNFHFGEAKPIDYWPALKEKTKQYILLVLGAPVVKVELDDQQLDLCFTETVWRFDHISMNEVGVSMILEVDPPAHLIKEASLARAMIVLGRVRSKYLPDPDGPDGHLYLDTKALIADGTKKLEETTEEFTNRYKKFEKA